VKAGSVSRLPAEHPRKRLLLPSFALALAQPFPYMAVNDIS
jgi:hypothetical protein